MKLFVTLGDHAHALTAAQGRAAASRAPARAARVPEAESRVVAPKNRAVVPVHAAQSVPVPDLVKLMVDLVVLVANT